MTKSRGLRRLEAMRAHQAALDELRETREQCDRIKDELRQAKGRTLDAREAELVVDLIEKAKATYAALHGFIRLRDVIDPLGASLKALDEL